MRKLVYQLSVGIFVLTLVTNAIADGSIYSTRTLGVSWYYPGGQAVGMGGVAISNFDPRYLNWINPAALPAGQAVRFSANFLYQNLETHSETQSFKTEYANFNGMMVSIPVQKRVSVAFGIYPLTNINFKVEELSAIEGYPYIKTVNCSGGLNSFFLMVGCRPLRSLLVGVSTNFILGKIDEDWRVDFADSELRDSFDQFRTKAWGMNYGLGFIAELLPGWRLGGIYSFPSDLHMKFETSYYNAGINTFQNKTPTYPQKIGIGTSYSWKNRWLLGFDFITQDWQDFRLSEENLSETVKDYRCAVGTEFTPSRQTHAFYLKQISYRVGFVYSQPHFLGYNGEKLQSYLFTFGFGLPFSRQSGMLDLGFEIGKMGNLEENMFAEDIFRLTVFFTSGERWFVR